MQIAIHRRLLFSSVPVCQRAGTDSAPVCLRVSVFPLFPPTPLTMPSLDWTFFPHMLDTIVASAINQNLGHDGLIRALRLTNRYVKDVVDRRIAQHVIVAGCPPVLSAATGRVCLPFNEAAIAAPVTTLDTYWNHDEWLDYEPLVFPNLKSVRTFLERGCLSCGPGGLEYNVQESRLSGRLDYGRLDSHPRLLHSSHSQVTSTVCTVRPSFASVYLASV